MKKRLGRGLEALLSGVQRNEEFTTTVATSSQASPAPSLNDTAEKEEGLLELDLKQLAPSRYQPRREIQEADLESLVASIKAQGIIQPIVVRKKSKDKYEILAGERRWRAAGLAGLKAVPVVIKDVPDENAMAIALIENIQRENLSALEEAQALERLAKEFDLTHQQVAEAVGKSRTAVTNLLRLLTLTEEVKLLLEKNNLEVGHAKALLSLKGNEQREAAQVIINKGLTVREAERLVSRMLETGQDLKDSARRKAKIDPDLQRLQDTLSGKLGAFVQILHGPKGKGRIVIRYHSLEELDGILEQIGD